MPDIKLPDAALGFSPKASGALATLSQSLKTQSAEWLASERSPAHSWHSPKLRPRTVGCSREHARRLDVSSTRRPQSASGHVRESEKVSHHSAGSLRSEEKWKTGELAPHCLKIVKSSRPDHVLSSDHALLSQKTFAQVVAESQNSDTPKGNRAGIPPEPHIFEKPWAHLEKAGRCTMEMDQPTLRHYVSYGRFQGSPFIYRGKRDDRFTHDVFNTDARLTRLADLRRHHQHQHHKIRSPVIR